MRTIQLIIAYDGTEYQGWQLQSNGPTIQEKLEKSIEAVFGKHHRVYGAGRTDAGVHAKAQVAHFKTSSKIPSEKIVLALNSSLPEDIVVTCAHEVPEDFHSQFDARSKTYRYNLINSRQSDPFRRRYAWRVAYDLNI